MLSWLDALNLHIGGWFLTALKVVQDRAVGSFVPMAALRKLFQRAAHCVEFPRLALELSRSRHGEGLHIGTRAAAIVPQCKQLADFLDRKSEIARAPDNRSV